MSNIFEICRKSYFHKKLLKKPLINTIMSNRKFTLIHFVITTLAFALFACELDGVDEVALTQQLSEENATASEDIGGANFRIGSLVYEEDFEGSKPFSTAHGIEKGASHSITYVSKPGDSKGKAAKFELRYKDPVVKGSKRVEVTVVKGESGDIGKDSWYAFDLLVPSDYKNEDKKELINQWHQDGDASAQINIKDGRFFWRFFINGKTQDYDLGAIQKGKWNTFVIHMYHSSGSDGITELWLNDKKLLNLKGKNMNSGDLPKWKVGIYKSNWMDGKTTVDTRVLYYDNIKVGNKQATYSDMTAGSTNLSGIVSDADTGSNTSTSGSDGAKSSASKIGGLMFVNADNEKDIYSLIDGKSISISEQGTHKITVRANTGKNVASVKFVLSGTQKYTYVDNVKPYSLFGDDAKGNYYFGPGLSTGKYTLTVTAYSDKKGKGDVLGQRVVNFVVTK